MHSALARLIHGKPIIYFDSAATGLKPQVMIDAVNHCYLSGFGNVGRGVHLLAQEALEAYGQARRTVADFINADDDEIVFTRNATEAINLVAASLPSNARVLIGGGEHHSNLLPWRTRHECSYTKLNPDGSIDIQDFQSQLQSSHFDLVAVNHISNVTGAIQMLDRIGSEAKARSTHLLVDASQSVGSFACRCSQIGMWFSVLLCSQAWRPQRYRCALRTP